MAAVLIVALVVVALIAGWVAVKYAAYKAGHPYTKADIEGARKQSVSQSRSITLGKTQENLAPLFPEFLNQFNPNDARFLGAPIDFIVFDGLCEGDDVEVREVVFVEVKTGKTKRLNKNEQRVRAAIEGRRVSYQLLHMPNSIEVSAGNGVPALDASEAPTALRP
jgi:predicted Holliday junction resolvase-like endonuclease